VCPAFFRAAVFYRCKVRVVRTLVVLVSLLFRRSLMTTDFVFRGWLVVSRYHCHLSDFALRHIRSQLSDFWAGGDDSLITIVQY